jgi:hypothetical protein
MERITNTPEAVNVIPDGMTPEELAGKLAEVSKIQIQGFFGLNDLSPAESKMLSEMSTLFNGKQDADLLWEIRNIENRIGTPPLGMSRLQHVYNYLNIQKQITQLESKRDAFLN